MGVLPLIWVFKGILVPPSNCVIFFLPFYIYVFTKVGFQPPETLWIGHYLT